MAVLGSGSPGGYRVRVDVHTPTNPAVPAIELDERGCQKSIEVIDEHRCFLDMHAPGSARWIRPEGGEFLRGRRRCPGLLRRPGACGRTPRCTFPTRLPRANPRTGSGRMGFVRRKVRFARNGSKLLSVLWGWHCRPGGLSNGGGGQSRVLFRPSTKAQDFLAWWATEVYRTYK